MCPNIAPDWTQQSEEGVQDARVVGFSEMGAVEGGEAGLSRRLSEFLLDSLGYRGEDIQPCPPVVLLKPPE